MKIHLMTQKCRIAIEYCFRECSIRSQICDDKINLHCLTTMVYLLCPIEGMPFLNSVTIAIPSLDRINYHGILPSIYQRHGVKKNK